MRCVPVLLRDGCRKPRASPLSSNGAQAVAHRRRAALRVAARPTVRLAHCSASSMIASMIGWNCAMAEHARRRASPLRAAPALRIRPSARACVGAGDDEVELAVVSSSICRVEHVLAVRYSRRARRRSGPRNGTPESVSAAEAPIIARMSGSFSGSWPARCRRSAFRCEDLPERADGSAGRSGARSASSFSRRPAFTLEEAARDLAGRVGLFLVVDGEREKIHAGLRALLSPTAVHSTVVSP